MRVLHIYSGQHFGGVETYLITLARFQSLSPELESEFGLCVEGRLSRELQEHNAKIHWLGALRARHPWTVLAARRTLKALLRERNYDAVIAHDPWLQTLLGAGVREAGVPLIFYQHNIYPGRHWSERWASRVPPDYAICNSHFSQTSVANLYQKVESEVIYFPVAPTQRLLPAERGDVRSELKTPADAKVIIQVSRIVPWKGQALHLSALGKLAQIPDWVVWFVGSVQVACDRQYFADLQEQAARLGIRDRVRFLGQRNDVPRLLAAADIFCQPNTGSPEPFGIVFVEALWAGLPVVATAIGGALEIVDDTCGILVPPDDPDSLAKALRQMIVDPELRSRLASRAPDRARFLCEPQKQVEALRQLLARIVLHRHPAVAHGTK